MARAKPHGEAAIDAEALTEPVRAHGSELRLALAAVSKDRLAFGGLLVLILAVALSILAPWLSPYDPTVASEVAQRLSPPLTPGHLLGTDEQGRDILSRILWGGCRSRSPSRLSW